ncbi:MAG: NUDIX hydrolase [Gammaproteobacteria bacterium]|nr:NUDIX hydrolase [Gammaproteobacteria bacterium]
MKNPWTILTKRDIYENPWIQLTEFEVVSPGGKKGIYGRVHFQNQAVGVVPFEDGWIWMVGQYRFPLDSYSWEIPEGGSPNGEAPLETAQRELKEETGLIATNYEPLFEMHLSNSISDEWGIVYLTTGLKQGETEPEHTEQLQIRKVKLIDAYKMVENKEITDSLTVAAIFKLMLMQTLEN